MANVHPHYTRCGCKPHAVEFCPLHAAAPALLEALEAVVEFTGAHGGPYVAARAAIAQAKGERQHA